MLFRWLLISASRASRQMPYTVSPHSQDVRESYQGGEREKNARLDLLIRIQDENCSSRKNTLTWRVSEGVRERGTDCPGKGTYPVGEENHHGQTTK